MATCARCRTHPAAPLFVLAEHELFLRDTRFRFMITTFGNRTDLAPFVLSVGDRCARQLVARRGRARLAATLGLSGIAIGFGGIIAGLASLPTPVTLGLLFGGLGWFAVVVCIALVLARGLNRDLGLEMSNVRLDAVTTSRAELDGALKRRGLGSAGVRDEIDKLAAAAVA